MSYLDEAQIEAISLDYFRGLGYAYVHGPDIATDGDTPERTDYGQVVLIQRLRDVLLPMLMCGEIDAPDAEQSMRRAV
ncbi:MAG: restriction endonuclease subunit R [Kiritimatiellae bacterium]|nr:restriction endonuclease subunit R [Kiritimatiellia bacterium]